MKKKLIMTFIIGAMLVAGCSNNGATTKTNDKYPIIIRPQYKTPQLIHL